MLTYYEIKRDIGLVLLMLMNVPFSYSANHKTDFWQPTNGPYGGKLVCSAMDSVGNIFVGTVKNGVFRSSDNGNHWQEANVGLDEPFTSSIGVQPNGTIYLGTQIGGVYCSSDHGEHWVQKKTGLPHTPYTQGFTFHQSGMIFVGIDGDSSGVYATSDNGEHWNLVGLGHTAGVAMICTNSGGIFAATVDSGIYRSLDTGKTWVRCNSGLSTMDFRCFLLTKNGEILAGAESGLLYRSSNNGESWVQFAQLPHGLGAIAINQNGDIFAGAYNGVSRKLNNESAWEYLNDGMPDREIHTITINPTGELYCGTYGCGFFSSSDNGSHWSAKNAGLSNEVIRSIAIAPGNRLFASSDYAVYSSTNAGADWIFHNVGTVFHSMGEIISTSSGTILVHNVSENTIYRTTDFGAYWESVNEGLITNHINHLIRNINDDIFITTSDNGIFRSTDNGFFWNNISAGLEAPSLYSAACDESGGIYASSVFNDMYYLPKDSNRWIYKSSPNITGYITAMFVSHQGHLFVAASGDGDYVSIDSGETFLPMNITYDIRAFQGTATGEIIAGTYRNGVFHSTDDGNTWLPMGSGIVNDISSFAIDSAGYLFAGTYSKGIFKSVRILSGIAENESPTPYIFNLSQNYPNPFNPLTVIGYSLSVNSIVSLKVYDVLGREVATLVNNETMEEGAHEVSFNASSLSSGVYFYRITAKGENGQVFTQEKKLVLMK